MPELENPIMKRTLVRLVEAGAKIFRNNNGQGFQGQAEWVRRAVPSARLYPGDVILRSARRLNFGLGEGSPDLVGYLTITVGPEHLGKRLAIFTGVEMKNEVGNTTKQQRHWLEVLKNDGCIAIMARSEEDAVQQLRLPE